MRLTKLFIKGIFVLFVVFHFLIPAATQINGFYIRIDDFFLIPLFIFVVFLGRLKQLKFPKITSLDRLLVLLLVCFTITTLLSANFNNSLNALLDYYRCYVAYFLFRVVLSNKILDTREGVKLLFFTGVLLTIIGVLQFVTNIDIGFFLKYLGQNTSNAYEETRNVRRIIGTVANTNIYGQWIGLLSLSWALIQLKKNRSYKAKLVYSLVYMGSLFIMLATVSRGVVLFAVLSSGIILFLRFNIIQKYAAVLLGIPILFVTYYLFELKDWTIFQNFLARGASNQGDDLRLQYITLGIEVLSNVKVLLFGTGLNALFPALQEYNIYTGFYKPWLDHTTITDSIHNAFLKFLVETGVVSFIIFCKLYYSIIKNAYFLYKKTKTSLFLAVFLGLIVPLNVYNSTVSFYVWLPVLLLIAIQIQENTNIRVRHLKKSDVVE